MGRIVRKAVLVGLAVLGVAGCQGTGSRPPADPLFVSKRPIESKAAYGPVMRAVQLEVPAPQVADLVPQAPNHATIVAMH